MHPLPQMFLSLIGFVLFIAFIGWLLEMWYSLQSLRDQVNMNERRLQSLHRSVAALESLKTSDSLKAEINEIYECLKLLDDQMVEVKTNIKKKASKKYARETAELLETLDSCVSAEIDRRSHLAKITYKHLFKHIALSQSTSDSLQTSDDLKELNVDFHNKKTSTFYIKRENASTK